MCHFKLKNALLLILQESKKYVTKVHPHHFNNLYNRGGHLMKLCSYIVCDGGLDTFEIFARQSHFFFVLANIDIHSAVAMLNQVRGLLLFSIDDALIKQQCNHCKVGEVIIFHFIIVHI